MGKFVWYNITKWSESEYQNAGRKKKILKQLLNQ